jgi:ATP-dependent helicase Lhr and Lhr-like helicase
MVAISAADPLNLTGVITVGQRIAAQHKHRILYRDGVPVAISANGKIDFFAETTLEEQWQGRNLLLRKQHPGYREQPRYPV